jgi:chromate transporter
MTSTPPPDGPFPPRSLAELFTGFLSIGARSFGGVMPWAYRTMVEERRWLTPEDFADTVGLCQFLPGPNIGNASIVLGKRWFGVSGAIVGFLGLFALPFIWVIALASIYADFGAHHVVRAVVTGIGAAAAGLFISTALKIGRPLARKPAAVVLIAACFVSIAFLRVSLFTVLPIAALIAFAFAWNGRL